MQYLPMVGGADGSGNVRLQTRAWARICLYRAQVSISTEQPRGSNGRSAIEPFSECISSAVLTDSNRPNQSAIDELNGGNWLCVRDHGVHIAHANQLSVPVVDRTRAPAGAAT